MQSRSTTTSHLLLGLLGLTVWGFAQGADKPNILVIFGDDVGMWNVGAYTHGMMGHTPNIDRSAKDDKPFFVWFNPTRMHIWTHVPQEYIQKAVDEGRPEIDVYRAGMLQHDDQIGQLLKKLDDLGIADNTIVVYSTDNGYELLFWPDGGYAPFRGEKGTTWEGGVRVPLLVRWPGNIAPGSSSNGLQSHEDLGSSPST